MSGIDYTGRDENDRGQPEPTGSEDPRQIESQSRESQGKVTHDSRDPGGPGSVDAGSEDPDKKSWTRWDDVLMAATAVRKSGRHSGNIQVREWMEKHLGGGGGQSAFGPTLKEVNTFLDEAEADEPPLLPMPEEVERYGDANLRNVWRIAAREADSAYRARRERLEAKLSDANESIKLSEAQYVRVQGKAEALEAEIGKLREAAGEADTRVEVAEAKIEARDATIADLKSERTEALARESEMKAALEAVQPRIQELERELGARDGRLEVAGERIREVRADFEERLRAAETRLREVEGESNEAQRAAAGAEGRAVELERRAERAERLVDKMIAERSGAPQPPAPEDGGDGEANGTPAKPGRGGGRRRPG